MVGNTFTIADEMGEMATPFLREVLPSAVTISPETLDIGGYLTTQNVRDGHIMGGGGEGVSNTFSYPNVNGF